MNKHELELYNQYAEQLRLAPCGSQVEQDAIDARQQIAESVASRGRVEMVVTVAIASVAVMLATVLLVIA